MNSENRRKRKKKLKAGRVVLTVAMMAVITLCVYFIKDYFDGYVQSGSGRTISQSGENAADFDEAGYDYIEKQQSDISTGDLILVNNTASYTFPRKPDVVSLYGEKNQSYKVSDKNVALNLTVIPYLNKMMEDFEKAKNNRDILIVSGYRTTTDQERILNSKAKQLGEAGAASLVARPGYSEHHTGYAIDIGIYKENGQSQSYTGSGKYGWINENCGNYGFILRYCGNKEEITGIADEPWHYRYVGIPHANIIKNNGFCLEEYIEYLKSYDFKSRHLKFTNPDGTLYEIYYIRASIGKTDIPVPVNKEYSISGNNVDGFIVTVREK